MTYEQRCPICGKLTFYVGDVIPGMLCQCGQTFRFTLGNYVYRLDENERAKLTTERDEARRWALRYRRFYRQMVVAYCNQHDENAALRAELERLKEEKSKVWDAFARAMDELHNPRKETVLDVDGCLD